jgi:hypothetical protein
MPIPMEKKKIDDLINKDYRGPYQTRLEAEKLRDYGETIEYIINRGYVLIRKHC